MRVQQVFGLKLWFNFHKPVEGFYGFHSKWMSEGFDIDLGLITLSVMWGD